MHQLANHQELLDLTDGDPWVRWSVADPLTGEAWVHEGIALIERVNWQRGFWVAPLRPSGDLEADADSIRSALIELRDGGYCGRLRTQSISVTQKHAAVAENLFDLAKGAQWEWMWTETAPPRQPGEDEIVELNDSADAEEMLTFARTHNPRVWASIGTGQVRRWVGVRSEAGDLLAVGGAEEEDTGVPHLTGIVTATEHRGRGLGQAISAHLTRAAVGAAGVCTLGIFSDNATARRLYERLGYRTAGAWHSRLLRLASTPS